MIRINEVGPRDGLQNEKQAIPTDVKVAYVNALSRTGVAEIEVSAFVSPEWIPQLADAEDVFARIDRNPGVIYSALVPNQKGLERVAKVTLDRISVFTATSETFTHKNVNTTIEGTFERFEPVVEQAHAAGLSVRGYISTAFWCPYEGKMPPEKTVELCKRLFDVGVETVDIADTIGKARPDEVKALLERVLPTVQTDRISLHFHDTYGHGPANVRAAYALGVEMFDSSAGGIGGCPYAPGARGNVATEVTIGALREAGADVRLDVGALSEARSIVADALGRAPEPSLPARSESA